MTLTMYEVNFGEAILITEGNHQLLVDCGAKFGGKGKTAAAAVQGQWTQTHKEALVTHFDEDHYNGLIELAGQVQLEHIYLPLYKYSRGIGVEETEAYLNNVVRVWCYQRLIKHSRKLDVLHRLLLSLPGLVGRRGQVSCVGKGDHVNCGSKVWNVLWPEPKNGRLQRYVRELEDMVGKYTMDRREHVQQTVERYTQALVAVYALYAEQSDTLMSEDRASMVYQDLEDGFQQLVQLTFDHAIEPEDTLRMRSIFQSVIRSMNDSSVVMECPGEALLLGDIGKDIYRRFIVPQLEATYKVVKVSHHGTKAYYSPNLPDAKVYLVSNSGRWNTNWRIYEEYRKSYPQKMQCTNTVAQRCPYALPVCNQCRVGQAAGTGVVDVDAL